MAGMDQIVFDSASAGFIVPPDEFLRAPQFAAVRDEVIDAKLSLYEGGHLLNRLILEEGRLLCHLAALSLHAAQDMAKPGTWLTLGRLQREVTALGVASRNRVEAQVCCLRKYGFLTQQSHPSDRRVRLLVPSEALLARDAAALGVLLNALARFGLSPAIGYAGPPHAPLHQALRRATARRHPAVSRLVRRHPLLTPFLAHDCGYMILLLVLRSAREDSQNGNATGYQWLAKKTGVSRTHVRRLLEAAGTAGLLTMDVRGGHDMRPTSAMWQVVDRWFADQFAFMDLLLREALAA
jgi:hypothetical protein